MQIPFNRPYLTGKEMEYLKDALHRRELSGDGYYTKKVTLLLEKKFFLDKVLLTTSCSHALEMAIDLIELKEGDEVIMPSFTFPSTANAVITRGGKPVFAEIKASTLNIDPGAIEKKISPKTKAIIPVHYAGIACAMDEILALARKYKLYVIEDAAQGVNARYQGSYLGGIGDLGCYSFHASKNYVSGEGGALVINKANPYFQERAEIIREKGTNRKSFLRGEVDKYTWVDRGSSYLPSDLLMAVLYAQLEAMDEIKIRRRQIFQSYYNNLQQYLSYPFLDNITTVPENMDSNYHLFYLKFKEGEVRDYVLNRLRQRGIGATFHYLPLHLSPMGQKLGYQAGDLPITEKAAATILRLPLYPDLTEQELSYIINNLTAIFEELQ